MITSIIIVTADRPGMLSRALESVTRSADRYQRRPRLLVVDGSREPSNRDATRAVVAAVRADRQALAYVGPAEASALLARLRQRGAPAPESISGSAGANRTLGLLLSAGENVLCLDDDIVCDTWALPGGSDELVVMGHDELRHVAFYPDRRAALAAASPVPLDLIGAHEALLSRSLPELIDRAPPPPDLTRACAHLWNRLREHQPLVVKLTFAGLAGDSGTSTPRRLLLSSGSFRDRLWSSHAAFTTALTSREVVRIARSNVVTHRCHCMAGCMGVSTRDGVPPFPWISRGEDGVFGVLVSASDPGALFGHVPVGIIHDSHRASPYGEGWIQSARQVRLSELMIAWIVQASSSMTAAVPDQRLREIGAAMSGIASLALRDFVPALQASIREVRLGQLEHAERAATGCPPYWREALDEHREACFDAMTRPDFFLPIEYHGASSLEAGFAALQAFAGKFGTLLASWPAVWEAARTENAFSRTA
jgi:hypothetical protein